METDGPSYLFLDWIHASPSDLLLAFGLLFLLLFLSGLVSGSEVALFSLKSSLIKNLKISSNKNDLLLSHLLEKPKKLLATLLIANNLINISIVLLSYYISKKQFRFEELFPDWLAGKMEFLIQIVVITFLIVMFGEVIPKIYANNRPLVVSRRMARFLFFLNKILAPFSNLLAQSTKLIDKKYQKKKQQFSLNELSEVIELNDEVNQDEENILKGIVSFGSFSVKQIMRSRQDITAIEYEMPFDEMLNFLEAQGYSRVPVFKEDLDNIVGILYVKDLIGQMNQKPNFKWQKLIREPYFVPDKKKIDALLKDFQAKRIHLAIAVDEYGGCSGLITLEDILEQIVGDINDEFDEEEIFHQKIDAQNYLVEGKVLLTDLNKIIAINWDEVEKFSGESDSLAGLLLEIIGEIPEEKRQISLQNHIFTIEKVDDRRILSIKITLPEAEI